MTAALAVSQHFARFSACRAPAVPAADGNARPCPGPIRGERTNVPPIAGALATTSGSVRLAGVGERA